MNAAGLVGISRTVRLDGGAHLGLNASANLSSYYNPVLGTVTQSLAGGAGVSWSRKRLTFAAGIQASHSLPLDDPNAFRAYGATAGAGYQVSPLLSLRAGGYWAHQILPPSALLTNANPDNWAASIGVNLSAPPIKF